MNTTEARVGKVRLAAGVVVALLLGWCVLFTASADQALRAGRPELAIAIDPRNAAAHLRLSNEALVRGDGPAAERAARAVLRREPLSAGAVRDLALARGMQGDSAAEAALFSQAAALGWRDQPTQHWLLDAAAGAGANDIAAQRLDALLRVDPGDERLYAMADRFADVPGLRAAFVARLAIGPFWRANYLRYMDQITPGGFDGRDALLLALAHTSAPPTREELAPYFQLLSRSGALARARRLAGLLAFAGPARADDLLYDDGFELSSDQGNSFPFEWTLRASANATTAFEARNDGRPGRALHVDTSGDSVDTIVSQKLDVMPGVYRMTIEAWGDPAASDALRWSLACPGTSGLLPSARASSPLGGGHARIMIESIIPAPCPSPSIMLRTTPVGSTPVSAWFDNATLTRLR